MISPCRLVLFVRCWIPMLLCELVSVPPRAWLPVSGCSPTDMQSATLRTASRRLSSIASTLQQASIAPATRRMPKTKVAIVGACARPLPSVGSVSLMDCPMHLAHPAGSGYATTVVQRQERTRSSTADTRCPTFPHSNWGSTIAKICGEMRVQLRV